jgi:hypothetical protein
MFKKFISMVTASILLTTGISIATAAPSSAITISDGSTVAMVSTAASMTNCIVTNTPISTTTRVRNWTTGDNIDFSFVGAASFVWDSTHDAAFTRAIAGNSATRGTFTPVTGTTYTFYRLREGTTNANYFCRPGEVNLLINGTDAIIGWVVSPTTFFTSGGSTGNSTDPMATAFAAALAKAAEVVKAKAVLTTLIAGNKPANVQEFANADFKVRNNNVAEKVSAAMMKLSVVDRENTQKINEIIKLEDFIDRISVLDTRSTVKSRDLISRGLLPATSTYKFSVVQGLASYPSGSLDSMEKIDAAIKEQIFKAEAPKRRLAEIQAKIAARKK